MVSAKRFFTPGSPLEGKAVPRDWFSMDVNGKRQALISYGYARDWNQASAFLSGHANAVRQEKRRREDQKRYWQNRPDRKDLD